MPPVFFLRFFIFRPGGTAKTHREANSSSCWMKSPKVDESWFIWMKIVKMDDFLVTRMIFFWVQILLEIGQR